MSENTRSDIHGRAIGKAMGKIAVITTSTGSGGHKTDGLDEMHEYCSTESTSNNTNKILIVDTYCGISNRQIREASKRSLLNAIKIAKPDNIVVYGNGKGDRIRRKKDRGW